MRQVRYSVFRIPYSVCVGRILLFDILEAIKSLSVYYGTGRVAARVPLGQRRSSILRCTVCMVRLKALIRLFALLVSRLASVDGSLPVDDVGLLAVHQPAAP